MLNRQVGQESFNLLFALFTGMGFVPMVPDITLDLIAIGLFVAIRHSVVVKLYSNGVLSDRMSDDHIGKER